MDDTGTAALRYVVVHGHRRAYRMEGSGPVLLLLHGLGSDSSTWDPVFGKLAEKFTVIAPDLLGHGASAKPEADYSLGGYANGMRDLLTVLDIDKVTVVGHSLGGGVAMQFAYQFPERTERVVLVSTGGLGDEVSPLIRFLTVPGSGHLIGLWTLPPFRPVINGTLNALAATGLRPLRDLDEVAKIYRSFYDARSREAVRRVTSNVMNWRKQLITMTDRAYLARLMPVLVFWGDHDMVIPTHHAQAAAAYATNSEVHVFADSGHFPHKDHPDQFVRVIEEFVAQNEPAQYHRGRWRALMRRGDQDHLSSVG